MKADGVKSALANIVSWVLIVSAAMSPIQKGRCGRSHKHTVVSVAEVTEMIESSD